MLLDFLGVEGYNYYRSWPQLLLLMMFCFAFALFCCFPCVMVGRAGGGGRVFFVGGFSVPPNNVYLAWFSVIVS